MIIHYDATAVDDNNDNDSDDDNEDGMFCFRWWLNYQPRLSPR